MSFLLIALKETFTVMTLKLLDAISLINTNHLLHIHYCTLNHRVSVARLWRVGADALPRCRHICLSIITGRGMGTETCGVDCVFSPDDIWFGLDINMNCTVLCKLYLGA